jgi:hypothetical protein
MLKDLTLDDYTILSLYFGNIGVKDIKSFRINMKENFWKISDKAKIGFFKELNFIYN